MSGVFRVYTTAAEGGGRLRLILPEPQARAISTANIRPVRSTGEVNRSKRWPDVARLVLLLTHTVASGPRRYLCTQGAVCPLLRLSYCIS